MASPGSAVPQYPVHGLYVAEVWPICIAEICSPCSKMHSRSWPNDSLHMAEFGLSAWPKTGRTPSENDQPFRAERQPKAWPKLHITAPSSAIPRLPKKPKISVEKGTRPCFVWPK
jgi:hypothetical protein